jgi:hypothetical protein
MSKEFVIVLNSGAFLYENDALCRPADSEAGAHKGQSK